ncbi:bifunctional 3,4-dihydroxy-2-butanone-4-phosphate synthase/GTP cyclohydrolase II [Methylophaga sp.]|uniref:bifunctional 3,4-dihydroxy-2-butanone-4-phosphate synthase/GTP cyclohydrolase II n=1 Tax=Methylophaga sp. TaxID=2024840 RepID=UPI001400DDDB|nr:bifunctional 3,4-dihydroxy-2-butanone-4-phosphate synthase/GTP cyclohydrolase II [Methylophaga sp.]MTI62413.1 3,4-dihydroxy-2-butanone-4-phosphate synthase [Methylophaga sp.]
MNSPTIPFVPRASQTAVSPIEDIIDDIRQGKMVVLMDDEDRENEGDLIMAADAVDADAINFMAMHGRGLICLTLTEARCRQLDLSLMVRQNGSGLGTNFTVSIEAAEGVTTGISTADRARTVQAAVAKNAQATDIVRPGHIFPLKAQEGGVLARAGHTEAGCDLSKLAGREPAAVICEIMNDDGSMARLPDLLQFADKHQLKVGTIADLIEYRRRNERLVAFEDRRYISTLYGSFEMVSYRDLTSDLTHVALICGSPQTQNATLVRVHAPINNFDFLDNRRHGHTWSVTEAMQHIQEAGEGVLLLIKGDEQEWQAQVEGERHFDEEYVLKHYGIGAQILKELGIGRMRLMTWPRKLPSMSGFGLSVDEYVLPEDLNERALADLSRG